MEELIELEPYESHTILDIILHYYSEIGVFNLVVILVSVGFCFYISLRRRKWNKNKAFREICIITLLSFSWLMFDTGSEVIKSFNTINPDGKMKVEAVLIDMGECAFQIQAISCYLMASALTLILVSSRAQPDVTT